MLISTTIAAMHASAARLLDAAKRAGVALSFSDFGRLLDVSPQTLTNWKFRGVSKDGALDAEAKLGISASYVLTGASSAQAPPPPPPGFRDASIKPTKAELQLLADIRLLDSPELRAKLAAIHQEADNVRRVVERELSRFKGVK